MTTTVRMLILAYLLITLSGGTVASTWLSEGPAIRGMDAQLETDGVDSNALSARAEIVSQTYCHVDNNSYAVLLMNQLQAVALNEGLRYKKRLWRDAGRKQLEAFRLAPWASRRRHDLLELLDRLNPTIAELTQAIEREVEKCPEARRLQTHPGVGPLTALAFVLIIGKADRFQCGKQIASYLGLVPLEDSSGNRRRLGHITKQGNSLLRFLLVEAAQVTARCLPEWRSKYVHLTMRRGRKIAKVAMARRLAVRLYWMMRKGWDYEQVKKFGSHAGQPGPETDYERALVGMAEPSTRAKWRALRSARVSTPKKCLTGATLSETRCFISCEAPEMLISAPAILFQA